MKKVIVFLVLIALVSCKSKKVSPTPVIEEVKTVQLALTAVDANQKGKAYDLGKRILMTCNTSKFKPFTTSEATQSVINNITLEKLSKTCAKHRQWYGTFIDLKLVEVYQNSAEQNTVYRFKAMYTKKVANKELRVFMNDENQLTAIKTLDWNNAFTY
ncbi:hypothetical protein H8R23_15380 [Flavobacterium sp. F-380]|uniref:Lipoprotein n=1 Tax=Flavobacterium kayseriense TaxID=2764714 RepID=A0ABR7JBD1_9FLAO|nr:hypothetical protein [Flavobacterium kayseriense]MBC5842795.1 hypothetical protein [Flavobacterium kayseriense]MBC5849325.1 hypothetical protein [Flavobacterium kayseriense]